MKVYNTNGGGRDTYCYRDNGGFTNMQDGVKWPEIGSISQKPLFKKPMPNPVMQSKTIFYKPDGTGRDTYIDSTAGGNFNVKANTYEYREKFKQSLRHYERAMAKVNPPRPAFSAVMGQRKINNKFDRRFLKDINVAKIKANSIRQSLDIKGNPIYVDTSNQDYNYESSPVNRKRNGERKLLGVGNNFI